MVELASNRARRISGRFLFGKNLAIAAARDVHATPTVAVSSRAPEVRADPNATSSAQGPPVK